ncbi:MAG: hypothetical protein ACTHJK_09500 [Sphingomicrobium sp.]
MILKLLNWQGVAGIAVSLALAIMLLIQKGETRDWKKQSASFEQLYRDEQAAFSTTVADYRAAADQARAADEANAGRVAAEQKSINQRTANDYENRLDAAHALAQRLRDQAASAAANSGAGANASMSGLPAAAGGAAQGTGQDRLSLDERELATEQAIQLDELIKWVRAQASVDPSGQAAMESAPNSR